MRIKNFLEAEFLKSTKTNSKILFLIEFLINQNKILEQRFIKDYI